MANKWTRLFSVSVILTLLISTNTVPKFTHHESVNRAEPSPIALENKNNTQVNPEYVSEETHQLRVSEDFVNNTSRIVIKLSKGTNPNKIAQHVNAEILRIGPLDYITLSVDSAHLFEAIERLRQTPEVLNVNTAQKVKTAGAINPQSATLQITDPYYSEQWGLTQAEVQKSWGLGATGLGITIAIIDTGVDINHPDLKANLVEGYNAITGRVGLSSVQDNNGHGTHVAGIAAAGLNGEGIVGVAYKAKLMPIKAMDRTGEGTDDVIADGIIWAADHGAKIINLSLGSDEETDILQEAIHYAQKKGCLLVAAAGNKDSSGSQSSIVFPASDPSVLAVTATDSKDQLASFSRIGPEAALAAPGVRIFSDYWQNRSGYASNEGTSMASPFVAGVAALVWSLNPELRADQVKILLENSARDLGTPGRDPSYGFGRVNAYWATKFAAQPETLQSPANVTWAGGIVQSEGPDKEVAQLTIPAKAFSLDSGKQETVQLTTIQDAPNFPQGITPAGEGILVKWESTIQKTLSLTVTLQIEKFPMKENQLAYLYQWTDSRWIKVGGGTDSTKVTAGLAKPGIYRLGYETPPENNRIAGDDRIDTALQISQASFLTGSETVILARFDDFPDALAGAPLAYKHHAPILLTQITTLPESVLKEIKRLNPRKVILLGGTGAISAIIENQLKQLATVQRIGGTTRYDTAAKIAFELGTIGEAVVVNGNNYPDAITIASIAAQKGIPILLTDSNNLAPETESALKNHSITQTLVIGGEGVISPQVFQSLPNPTRLSGTDRYATAAAVLQAHPPQGKLLFLATGENFPDALTGGVLAALNNSRIILVPPTGPSEPQQKILQPWSGQKVLTFGGSTLVPDAVVNNVRDWVK
jgi:minor extracellular protease Epr